MTGRRVMVMSMAIVAAALVSGPRVDARQAGGGPELHRRAGGVRGVVKPVRQTVISVPMEGVIVEVNVNEGDTVKAGQLLAQLDDRVARAAVDCRGGACTAACRRGHRAGRLRR